MSAELAEAVGIPAVSEVLEGEGACASGSCREVKWMIAFPSCFDLYLGMCL